MLNGCSSNNSYIEEGNSIIVDSINITIAREDETLNLLIMDSNNLLTYSASQDLIRQYKKAKDGHYEVSNELKVEFEGEFSILKSKNQIFGITWQGDLYNLNNKMELKYIKRINRKHSTLDSNLILVSRAHKPAFINDSVFIFGYFYSDFADFSKYVNSKPLLRHATSTRNSDFIEFGNTKVQDLQNYYCPFSIHTINEQENFIVLMYPQINQINKINLYSGFTEQIAVINEEFKKPSIFDYSKVNSEDYSAYETQFLLNEFTYCQISYINEFKEYYLFYQIPSKKYSERQNVHCLILDEYFKPKRKNFISTKKYYSPETFINDVDGIWALQKVKKMKNEKKYHLVLHKYNL